MKLTVIIPAYNCENTIKRAITSTGVFNNEYITVMVINNGSTDNTKEAVKQLCSTCERIIYAESNKGVSNARNEGIRLTGTEYLTFLDADDIYIGDGTGTFINNLNSNVDLAVYNYQVNDKKQDLYALASTSKETNERISLMLDNPTKLLTVWNKVYKTQIIKQNGIYFDTSLSYSEDSEFLIRYLIKSKKIKFFDQTTYQYSVYSDSTIHRHNPRMVQGYLNAIDKVNHDIGNDKRFVNSLNNFILMQFNLMMVHGVYTEDISYSKKITRMKRIINTPTIKAAVTNTKLQNIVKPRFMPVVLCKYHLYFIASIIYKIRVKQNEHMAR